MTDDGGAKELTSQGGAKGSKDQGEIMSLEGWGRARGSKLGGHHSEDHGGSGWPGDSGHASGEPLDQEDEEEPGNWTEPAKEVD